MKYYTATKSRNQGRDSWSVIFRHPVRTDVGSSKTGRRVRRGLGTNSEAEADRLVAELNRLLSTPELWESSARVTAASQYDRRIVDIFYDGLEATRINFAELRDQLLPLPGSADGYRKVLTLGTTGAGKTTMVRQILGTNPKTERFPSTSTAKTTVADTEIITTGDRFYKAAITFVPRDEVIDLLTENVSAAALATYRGRDDDEITRLLLDHVNQRFRFSYVLGRGDDQRSSEPGYIADDDLDDDEDIDDLDPAEYGEVDIATTSKIIGDAVSKIKKIVHTIDPEDLGATIDSDKDDRVTEEVVEENLDSSLRKTEEFHTIVDSLMDEIEKRFTTLDVGDLKRNRQGWPVTWEWKSDDRANFIRIVSRFSSNYAKLFGRLLTPLVNGIRVSGPFHPAWDRDESIRLVLVDGEGLGHTPKSASTLSTHLSNQVQAVDAILLVDNAAQPLQAAPVAALKSIALSGNAQKVHLVFTHIDQVKGDNLPTFTARENHVLASVENVLTSIGDELGPAAERALRSRIDGAKFFVGGIQEILEVNRRLGERSIHQIDRLLDVLAYPELASGIGTSRPVFDRMNISLAVSEAAKLFHARWRGLLGLDQNPDAPKEHWTRVKALSRRLAEGWGDEYDDLKPVADLRNSLQIQIYLLFQRPLRWQGGEPSAPEKQAQMDAVMNAVTKKLVALSQRRLRDDAQRGWQGAYSQSGPGSTFERSKIIASDVYGARVPIPSVSASPDQNRFLKDVAAVLDEIAQDGDIYLE
ncbi:hypothetical protein [Rhodococcus globerulus]|uniref:hypothetical protein n=1 Tax=Rhodococcus globerulus TaxID=33008 RepID=UPI000A433A19|nr:hypothetical protein [Rhodococcus globerulus]